MKRFEVVETGEAGCAMGRGWLGRCGSRCGLVGWELELGEAAMGSLHHRVGCLGGVCRPVG